jgi:hypothetical protein
MPSKEEWTMKRYAILLALALSVLLVQTAAANLVLNGGFDGFTDWTVSPDSPNFAISAYIDTHSSTYSLWFGATSPDDDTIMQTIPTVAGDSYTFSFWLKHLHSTSPNDFQASWNSTPVLTLINIANFDWTGYSYTETATGSTTIRFAGNGYYILDDVSVLQVPLPATVVLLGSGLLPLLGWRRFRKS